MANNPIDRTLGKALVVLDRVDSTNNYAMQQVREGIAQNGSAYFAHEQWAGKGQRGRDWVSNRGENLLLSTVLKPSEYAMTHPLQVSVAVALSCYDLVKNYLGAEDVRIKWPNDIYWQDRKTGGILIESIWKAASNDLEFPVTGSNPEWAWAIAGTGINLNQPAFHELGKKAVSILQVTGKKTDPLKAAEELLFFMEQRLESMRVNGLSSELAHYNEVLFRKDEEVDFETNEGRFSTTVREMDLEGKLKTDCGSFEWGSLKWL